MKDWKELFVTLIEIRPLSLSTKKKKNSSSYIIKGKNNENLYEVWTVRWFELKGKKTVFQPNQLLPNNIITCLNGHIFFVVSYYYLKYNFYFHYYSKFITYIIKFIII